MKILAVVYFLSSLVLSFFSNEYWSQQQRLVANDAAVNARLGNSVSMSPTHLVVGSSYANIGNNDFQGAAYIFTQDSNGWTQQQKLFALDGSEGTGFGQSVSVYGDYVVVGCPFDTIGTNAGQGSAYVYYNDGTSWVQQQKLIAFDGSSAEYFGNSVSIYGDYIVVGCFLQSVQAAEQGTGYIYRNNGTSWVFQQKIFAGDGQLTDYLGYSIAIYQDYIVAGAFNAYVGYNMSQGSAYIFHNNGTYWNQQQKLIADDGAPNDNFGYSVAIYGDYVVVGAYHDDVGSHLDQGSVYVFHNDGNQWSQQQLVASNGVTADRFGWSVAIYSNQIIVGSPYSDIDGKPNQGSIYVFSRDENGDWNEHVELIASDGSSASYFGRSVSIYGDLVACGADLATVTLKNQGAVYTFSRSDFIEITTNTPTQGVVVHNSANHWRFTSESNVYSPKLFLTVVFFLSFYFL